MDFEYFPIIIQIIVDYSTPDLLPLIWKLIAYFPRVFPEFFPIIFLSHQYISYLYQHSLFIYDVFGFQFNVF
jgi:hypothetical protein